MNYFYLYFVFLFFLIRSPFGETIYVSKESLWDFIKSETKSESSSPAYRIIQNVSGPCPNIPRSGGISKTDLTELCMELITSVVRGCKNPTHHAEYILYSWDKKSVKVVGVQSTSRFVIDKLIGKFCRIIVSSFQTIQISTPGQVPPYAPHPQYPPPYPSQTPPYPPPSPTLPSPPPPPTSPPPLPLTPILPPPPPPLPPPLTHTLPPPPPPLPPPPPPPLSTQVQINPYSPIHAEWMKIVSSAGKGSAGRYITSVPKAPFPTFIVGKDLNEKIEQCIKAIREMVKSSIGHNRNFVNGELILTVEIISNSMSRITDNLILRTNSEEPGIIKDIIKNFCNAVYTVESQANESTEWSKIHSASLRSKLVKDLPIAVPIFYYITASDTSSLINSCVEALEALLDLGTKGAPYQTSASQQGMVTFTGNYKPITGLPSPFSTSISCQYPCTKIEISQVLSNFCRGVYRTPTDSKDKKQVRLSSIYYKIQEATSRQTSPFGQLPTTPPDFLYSLLSDFSFDEQGAFSRKSQFEICKRFFNTIIETSTSRLPTQMFRSGPIIGGVSRSRAVKYGVKWSESLGFVSINFPFIEDVENKTTSIATIIDNFCREVFDFQTPPKYPAQPSPHPPSPQLPTPSSPVPVPDKYSGPRPPLGYPNQIQLMHVMVHHPGTTSLLSYSRKIWEKIHHHSSFGIGSASIMGVGANRFLDFIVSSSGHGLYNYCYNLFAGFYNTASEFRLTGDERKMFVSKTVSVDLGKNDEHVRTGTQKITIMFMIPAQGQNLLKGELIQQLIKKFCSSLLEIP